MSLREYINLKRHSKQKEKGMKNMQQKNSKKYAAGFFLGAGLLAAFAAFTLAVMRVDVQAIGPDGSSVGFASLNGWARALVGVNMTLYNITDLCGVAAIALALGFAVLGLVQLISRRSLKKVDSGVLLMGGFYLLVFAAYVFFEFFVVNYRPVLIAGALEASYPSSTTVLVMCVMPSAMLLFARLIKRRAVLIAVNAALEIFTAAVVAGRLLSGVHWLTDILGGLLLSAGLVTLYAAALRCADARQTAN